MINFRIHLLTYLHHFGEIYLLVTPTLIAKNKMDANKKKIILLTEKKNPVNHAVKTRQGTAPPS